MKKICPACQSKKSRLLFKKHQREYLACRNCGLQYVFPFPSKKEIEKYYEKDFWEKKAYRGKKVTGYIDYRREKESFLTYFFSVLKQLAKHHPGLSGKILDVGCGQGLFLKAVQNFSGEVYGLDLSAEAVKQAKKELGVETIFKKTLEESKFKSNFFDLVTSFQTIEHLTDLDGFLKEAWRVLKPGGVLLLAAPNAHGWQARLMGKTWFSYRHPDHLLFFNDSSLVQLLEKQGFIRVKKLKDPARVYSLNYLLEISQYYHRIKILLNLTKVIRKALGSLRDLKISIPLGSLVIVAQKD